MKPDNLQQAAPESFSWRLPAVAFPLPQIIPINRRPQQSRQALADVAAPMTTVIEQALTTWPNHLHAPQPFDIEAAISQLVRQAIMQSHFDTVGIEASLESVGPIFYLHEITSKGLLWAIHFLASELAFRRRVHHEVNAVLGVRPPTIADLDVLPCTRMLCQEAICWQADPFIPSLRLMQYVCHILPSGRPEQAAVLAAQAASSTAHLSGVGHELALLTSQLVLVMILQRYANLSLLGFSA